MTFASVKIGEFRLPMQIPMLGEIVLIVYSWTQVATDGGGAVTTGYGTTARNGEILAAISQGNVKDKPIGSVIDAAAGTVTIDVDATSGPTAGEMFILVKKS